MIWEISKANKGQNHFAAPKWLKRIDLYAVYF